MFRHVLGDFEASDEDSKVRTVDKQGADFFVYRPTGDADLHKAGAFGWAVNRTTVCDELSALTETGVRIAVAITL